MSSSSHGSGSACGFRSGADGEAIVALWHANPDDRPTVIGPGRAAAAACVLPAGERLGHFEVVEPIGRGGMAAVLKARDLELDRIVALKILPPDAGDPDAVQRFKQEARAAALLDHENIARVFFCGEDRGLRFIAFEYVPGENLRDRIYRGGRLHPAEAVPILRQLAAGLDHAAERGVVHRDIKPGNIVLGPDGLAKLVDMGLARSLDPAADGGVTHSNVTLGTYDYLSPEQALDPRQADVRSDIYSLGCTFYHALTGRPPVPEGTAAAKLHAHRNDAPIDPRDLNPAVPDSLAAVLGRMMAKDPNDRYATAAELFDDLGFVERDLASNEPIRLPAPVAHRSAPVLPILAASAAVMLLAWLLLPRSGGDRAPPWPEAPVGFAMPAGVLPAPAAVGAVDSPAGKAMPREIVAEPYRAAANERVLWPDAQPDDMPRRLYPTLSSALAARLPGETVLIAANGDVAVPLLPYFSESLTIRAAPGYRPTLVADGPPFRTDAAFFRVASGELVLEELDIRLTERQAIARVLGGAACSFRRCTIALAGPLDSAVVVIPEIAQEARSAPGSGEPPRVMLTECIVRGGGRVIWVQCPRAFEAAVEQCGIALSGSLIVLESNTSDAMMNPPQGRLALAQSTVVLDGPLMAVRAGGMPAFLEVDAADCLFAPLDPRPSAAALLRLDEADAGTLVSQFISWTGRGTAFGFPETAIAVEWRSTSDPVPAWDFSQWQRFARDDARLLPRVRFARGTLRPRLHAVESADFALSVMNPLPAGVEVSRLPEPAE